MSRRIAALWIVLASTVTAPQVAAAPDPLRLHSSAFDQGGSVPVRYTCQGAGMSPPLSWSGVPDGAVSLALTVTDPDAPQGIWVHWVVFNLPADSDGVPAGASGSLPGGAAEGVNGWGKPGYGGPCPPSGRHRYIFELYALDVSLSLHRPDREALRQAMASHVIAQARLSAGYTRQ